MSKAFAALEASRQDALHHELLALMARFDRGAGDALILPSAYLEVVMTRH